MQICCISTGILISTNHNPDVLYITGFVFQFRYLRAGFDAASGDLMGEDIFIDLHTTPGYGKSSRRWAGAENVLTKPSPRVETDPSTLGHCLFFSDTAILAFNSSWDFVSRSAVRDLDLPFKSTGKSTLNLILNHLIPSMMDFVGMNDTGSSAKFATTFQLGIVLLIDECLTRFGKSNLLYLAFVSIF
jgi:hypothetical protein